MRHLLVFGILFFAAIVSLRAQERLSDSVKLELRTPPALHKFQEPGFLQNPSDPLAPLRDHEISSDFPKTWSEFKAMFLAIPLSEELVLMNRFYENRRFDNFDPFSAWVARSQESDMEKEETYYLFPAASIRVIGTSILQELYNNYSREAKMKRKYESLVAQENKQAQVAQKYDVELVKKVTGFTDDKTAQEFMDFCDFKSDSILQANQYDLYNMIYDCLSQFVKERL